MPRDLNGYLDVVEFGTRMDSTVGNILVYC